MSINNSSQLTQPHAIRKIKDSWWPLWDSSLLSWDLNVDANSVSLYNRIRFSICEVTFSIIPGNTYFDLRSLTWSAARVDQGLVSLNQMDAVRRRFHSTAKSTLLRLELIIAAIQVIN